MEVTGGSGGRGGMGWSGLSLPPLAGTPTLFLSQSYGVSSRGGRRSSPAQTRPLVPLWAPRRMGGVAVCGGPWAHETGGPPTRTRCRLTDPDASRLPDVRLGRRGEGGAAIRPPMRAIHPRAGAPTARGSLAVTPPTMGRVLVPRRGGRSHRRRPSTVGWRVGSARQRVPAVVGRRHEAWRTSVVCGRPRAKPRMRWGGAGGLGAKAATDRCLVHEASELLAEDGCGEWGAHVSRLQRDQAGAADTQACGHGRQEAAPTTRQIAASVLALIQGPYLAGTT